MQRRVNQADDHRQAVHGAEDAVEVVVLQFGELVQRLLLGLRISGQDVVLEELRTVAQEHVLGAAQADALRAIGAGAGRLLLIVGVGPHHQATDFVGPAQNLEQLGLLFQLGSHDGNLPDVHIALGPVQRDELAFLDHPTVDGEVLLFQVDLDVGATGHARLAQLPRHHCRMAGRAAFRRQDTLGRQHTVHIARLGQRAHQDHWLAFLALGFGGVGIEVDLAHCRARRGIQALGHRLDLFQHLLVEARVQQLIDHVGGDARHGFGGRDQPFVHHVHGDLDCRGCRALAATGLQHPQLAVLDGELDVLGLAVVLFQDVGHAHQFFPGFGDFFGQAGDFGRRARTRYHVLTLGIEQVFAVELLLAGSGVAGEGHARAALAIGEVAIDHGHDVGRRAPGVRVAVVIAVVHRTLAVPALEHGLDAQLKLLVGIHRERLPGVTLRQVHETLGATLPALGGHFGVGLGTHARALFLDDLLEFLARNIQHHLAEHLNQAAVQVPGEAHIVELLAHRLDRARRQAHVEDGVHHARHGLARPRTDGDEQRVGVVAELLASLAVQVLHGRQDLFPHPFGELARVHVLDACLGGDGEAGRDGQADPGHLGQVAPLATQQVTHGGVTFFERIDPLMCHSDLS